MKEHFFELVPFTPQLIDKQTTMAQLDLAIQGRINRLDTALIINFNVHGTCDEVQWPSRSQVPQRKDNLWQHTCFELFLSEVNSKRYLEYNFSPSFDWNATQFQNYRNSTESANSEAPKIEIIHRSDSRHEYRFTVPLSQLETEQKINLGLTAIIESKYSQMRYFALVHTANEPDFHLRDSFVLIL